MEYHRSQLIPALCLWHAETKISVYTKFYDNDDDDVCVCVCFEGFKRKNKVGMTFVHRHHSRGHLRGLHNLQCCDHASVHDTL